MSTATWHGEVLTWNGQCINQDCDHNIDHVVIALEYRHGFQNLGLFPVMFFPDTPANPTWRYLVRTQVGSYTGLTTTCTIDGKTGKKTWTGDGVRPENPEGGIWGWVGSPELGAFVAYLDATYGVGGTEEGNWNWIDQTIVSVWSDNGAEGTHTQEVDTFTGHYHVWDYDLWQWGPSQEIVITFTTTVSSRNTDEMVDGFAEEILSDSGWTGFENEHSRYLMVYYRMIGGQAGTPELAYADFSLPPTYYTSPANPEPDTEWVVIGNESNGALVGVPQDISGLNTSELHTQTKARFWAPQRYRYRKIEYSGEAMVSWPPMMYGSQASGPVLEQQLTDWPLAYTEVDECTFVDIGCENTWWTYGPIERTEVNSYHVLRKGVNCDDEYVV